MLSITIGWNC
jgi:hypothetical protein